MTTFNDQLEETLLAEARDLFEANASGVLKWEEQSVARQLWWVDYAARVLGLELPRDLESNRRHATELTAKLDQIWT